jgi:hypothetical protein
MIMNPMQAAGSQQQLGQTFIDDELQGLINPSQGYNPSGNYAGSTTSGGYDYSGVSSGSVDQMINSIAGNGLFGSIFDNIGPIASTAGGLASVLNAYNRLGSIGDFANVSARQIGEDAFTRSQFKPFTVTTGMGSGIDVGATGDVAVGLTPQEQAIQQSMLTGAQQFTQQAMTPTAQREQEVFDRIRATQLAEEERQRLALEERLFNQGRLGVRTAMFGGTPEQLALAKAQEEAQARASLAAIQQAQAEQRQQAQLGTSMLGGAYVPEAQALNALQRGLLASQLAQRGQLYGTGLFGEASIAGLDALLGSGIGQAELMGRLGTGLLGGAMQGAGQGQGGIQSIISEIGGQVAPGIGSFLTDLIPGLGD